MHFIDLTDFHSLDKMTKMIESPLNDWLNWFCSDGENMKGLETILERNPAIKEAHKLYEQFTADNELMEKYEARQKYLRDVSTIRNVSREEGYNQGKSDGKIEGEKIGEDRKLVQLVLSMHAEGIPSPAIAKIAQISIDEVNQIISQS